MSRSLGFLCALVALTVVAFVGPKALADTILSEGFEGTFPGSWSAGDDDAIGTPAYWGKVYATFGGEGTHSGSYKGYCAGVGNAGSPSAPLYQNHMAAHMSRTLDLTGYSSATLSFWYKIPSTEVGADFLEVYLDGVLVWRAGYIRPLWQHVTVPLSQFIGASQGLTFRFTSDSAVNAEGPYLDDILVTGTPAKATISDAWWTQTIDNDGDGYMHYGLLQWNPNVVGGLTTLNVHEKIYYKLATSSTWTLLTSVPARSIAGTSTSDVQSFLVAEANVSSMRHNKYDFRIDIFRQGVSTADYARRDTNDTDLNNVRLETMTEERDYLPNDFPYTWSDCPHYFGFDVMSSHWAAVGINPAPSNKNLRISPHVDMSSPYRLSELSGAARDFLVVNGTLVHSIPYYARVQDGTSTAYSIEAENASLNLSIGATLSGRSFTSGEVLDVYQATLSSGHKYRVRIAQTSGSTSNIAVFVFSPARTTGSRGSREAYRNAGGAGAGELLTFTATRSGRWGIVVTNENAGSGHYAIKVEKLS